MNWILQNNERIFGKICPHDRFQGVRILHAKGICCTGFTSMDSFGMIRCKFLLNNVPDSSLLKLTAMRVLFTGQLWGIKFELDD